MALKILYLFLIFISVLAIHIVLLRYKEIASHQSSISKKKVVKISLHSVKIQKPKPVIKPVEPIVQPLVQPVVPKEEIPKPIVTKPKTKHIQKAPKKRLKPKRVKKRASKKKIKKIKKRVVTQVQEFTQKSIKAVKRTKTIQVADNSNELNSYKAMIRREIKRSLYYPKMARRMHIGGIVRIHFIVHRDGRISDITVLSSSHSILKKGAIRTMESISLPPFPEKILKKSLSLSIPIEFKIKE